LSGNVEETTGAEDEDESESQDDRDTDSEVLMGKPAGGCGCSTASFAPLRERAFVELDGWDDKKKQKKRKGL
jgi:hypothetical protein